MDIASTFLIFLLIKVCSFIDFILFFSFLSSVPGKGPNSSNSDSGGSGDSVNTQVVSWWQQRQINQLVKVRFTFGTVVTAVSIITQSVHIYTTYISMLICM